MFQKTLPLEKIGEEEVNEQCEEMGEQEMNEQCEIGGQEMNEPCEGLQENIEKNVEGKINADWEEQIRLDDLLAGDSAFERMEKNADENAEGEGEGRDQDEVNGRVFVLEK